ncbi:MFS transporter [Brevibacterium litoralis]|uniref:MFS transporter n=1 Tax=Brevibacterium litoralis TaxID=3138935 RepID=UPI0032EC4525
MAAPPPLRRDTALFRSVALLLFTAGWAANHFASMMGVLRHELDLSALVVTGAYGLYALGLVPGLLGGGGLADRLGPRPVVLTGALVAAGGNLLMSVWHPEAGVFVGRLVVGAGVGLAMSAGTAWAADLRGTAGATFAGIALTAGFAVGPIVSGGLALLLGGGATITVPFVATVLASLAAVSVAGVVASRSRGALTSTPVLHSPAAGDRGPAREDPGASGVEGASAGSGPGSVQPTIPERGVGRALLAALPMAMWVFSTAIVAFIITPSRLPVDEEYRAIMPGLAAGVGLSTGVLLQVIARRRRWGAGSGVAGAIAAACGFALIATGGSTPSWPMAVTAVFVLGTAYGLCLREGLTDVDRLAPPHRRGIVIGIYYVATYLGFGLPVLLEAVHDTLGPSLPLYVLAVLAAATAVIRIVHLTTTDHLRR